jgi:hypothetical protein
VLLRDRGVMGRLLRSTCIGVFPRILSCTDVNMLPAGCDVFGLCNRVCVFMVSVYLCVCMCVLSCTNVNMPAACDVFGMCYRVCVCKSVCTCVCVLSCTDVNVAHGCEAC